MKTARIAIATNNGDIGGGEVMLINIATALRSLGFEVLVVGPAHPNALVSLARQRGCRTRELRAKNRIGYIRALRRWRRQNRDIPLWCNGLVPSFATAGLGFRIVHLHILPTGWNRPAALVAKLGAERVLVPSHYMADRIAGATILSNWTEEIDFRPQTISDNRPLRVGFIGRLTRDKGVDVLARAVSLAVTRTGRDIRLVLAGENRFGDAKDDKAISSALEPISDRVCRLGWVSKEEFFAHVDLAVFPSVWEESFGLVVTEAMAAGTPFIVSDAGALPEVSGVDHPWHAKQGDSDDLARVLDEAASALLDGADAVSAGRRRWQAYYSPPAGLSAVRDVLREIDLLDQDHDKTETLRENS